MRQTTNSRARKAWTYIAGEKGRNRVRVYQRGAAIYLEYFTEDGKRERQSLGHGDQQRAKREADEIAAKFGRAESRPPAVLTLSRLFDIYEREVTPHKASTTQSHDRRAIALLLAAFGGHRRPETLTVRDWSSYIARRRAGEIAPKRTHGRKVRNRVIEQDCKFLLAVLNWAERARMLDRNPLRGLEVPKEESPVRPVMTAERFAEVRAHATELSSAAELFVCLLWFTGHRSASVRQLSWSDVDAEAIRWRAEVDKIGYEHRNPIHRELAPVLEQARAIAELTGETLLFPSSVKIGEPMTRQECCKLWRRIADAAGITPGSRLATHSFRRAFANKLRDVPMRELKDLGGWKTEKTVIGTYLQPDQDAQRAALERL